MSRVAFGLDEPLVRIEVHLAGGLPGYTLVGLPATTLPESRQRVKAAIENSGLTLPRRHVVVSLAPADLRKERGRFDLPIAIALLAAVGHLQAPNLSTSKSSNSSVNWLWLETCGRGEGCRLLLGRRTCRPADQYAGRVWS